MSDSGYNGYRNRATWLYALWLDNTESSQEIMEIMVQNCANGGMSKQEAKKNIATHFQNILENAYYDAYDDIESDFAKDMFLQNPNSLDIDYLDIADGFLEGYAGRSMTASSQNRKPSGRKMSTAKAPTRKSPAKKKPAVSNACRSKKPTKVNNCKPARSTTKKAPTKKPSPKKGTSKKRSR